MQRWAPLRDLTLRAETSTLLITGQTARRRGRLAVLVLATACVLTFWAGSLYFRTAGPNGQGLAGPRPAVREQLLPAVEPDLAAPDARAIPTRTQAAVEAPAGVETHDLADELDLTAETWALVARLEELARSPKTFHAAALPVIDRLTQVCSTDMSEEDAASAIGASTVVTELQRLVVAEPQRHALVRGAVFLALAPVVSEAGFWGTFTDWLSGHPDVPLELVRTAALAAARIGSPSPCKHPLPLTKLTALPTLVGPELPGFYPFALDRIASGRACDAMRRWLDLDDPRRRLFRLSSGAPPTGEDLGPAGDYFVTVEVLLCVWGHRSLVDTLVERALLQESQFTLDDLPERSLVNLRAANFLVLALARCNQTFFDAAVKAASDADSPLSDMLDEMEYVLVEELGPATLERLERLRYSERRLDQADMTVALIGLGKDFARDEAHDPEQRAVLLEYLGGLVADSGVPSNARLTAFIAVSRGGSWAAIREAASACFQPGAPIDLPGMAIGALMAEARSNPVHRGEVLELLQQFAAQAPASAAKFNVDAYIAELMP